MVAINPLVGKFTYKSKVLNIKLNIRAKYSYVDSHKCETCGNSHTNRILRKAERFYEDKGYKKDMCVDCFERYYLNDKLPLKDVPVLKKTKKKLVKVYTNKADYEYNDFLDMCTILQNHFIRGFKRYESKFGTEYAIFLECDEVMKEFKSFEVKRGRKKKDGTHSTQIKFEAKELTEKMLEEAEAELRKYKITKKI